MKLTRSSSQLKMPKQTLVVPTREHVTIRKRVNNLKRTTFPKSNGRITATAIKKYWKKRTKKLKRKLRPWKKSPKNCKVKLLSCVWQLKGSPATLFSGNDGNLP